MTTQEVLNFLQISRASLYRRYIDTGRLIPIRNPNLARPHLKFRRADVLAVAAHSDNALPAVAETAPPYDPRG